MSTIFLSPPPVASSSNFSSPESCISLASSLRCHYSGQGSELYHTLSILPVALEIIFTSALLFTNWRSGWRHLFLVAEGFLDFLLALLEVLSFAIPAVRLNISRFKAFDQAIGALSFTPLFFSMAFLYLWVRAECLPITPTRVQVITRLLLFLVIPAVIIVNMIASFVGISYRQGANHVLVTFAQPKDCFFIWTFFSSVTLALLTLFKTSCLCFAFYRLIRAAFTQRYFETTSKDAAVLFKGIGWMNGGIFLSAIETIVGFAFYGIPIAYVRRVMRLLSLALICIGVAKGIDEVQDFGEIHNELQKSRSAHPNFRRSKLRELISNPRLSTFHQLSPTATAFHARPRAPFVTSQDFANAASGRGSHPYATGGLPNTENLPMARAMSYTLSPSPANRSINLPDASPRPSLLNGLPGMSRFAQVKEKQMSQRPRRRVTIYYNDGTPTLHLSLPSLDLSYPTDIAEAKRRSKGNVPRAYKKFLIQTAGKSRFSTSSESLVNPDSVSAYPASTVDRHTRRSEVGYRSVEDSYDPSLRRYTTIEARSFTRSGSNKNTLPTPSHPDYTKRFSNISDLSGLSAAHAEIIDAPRRQLSFKRGKSALARAVFYPAPGTNVAIALTRDEKEEEEEVAPAPAPIRKLPHLPNPPLKVDESKLLINRRLSPLHLAPIKTSSPALSSPSPSPHQRQSVVDEDGSVLSVTAISLTEEEIESGEERSTRKPSEYSVRSIQETLQAVREMAVKFPVLPPSAVDVIGQVGNDSPSSRYTRPSTVGSTDTEEFIRSRIPAEEKMKGRAVSVSRPALLFKNTPPGTRLSVQQPPPSPLRARHDAKTIDPFFNVTDSDGTTPSLSATSPLSPLPMSVKLRHPQSLISNVNGRSPTIGSPSVVKPAPYHDGMDTIDFGTALKEWGMGGGQRKAGVRVTGDLSRIVGSARGGQVGGQRERYDIADSENLGEMPEEFKQFRRTSQDTAVTVASMSGDGALARIKSIGNAPRRVRPQPIVGHKTLGSLYLHPFVVSPDPRDVPMPAVRLGGSRDGVNEATLE